jgi:hypothetical protein
MPKYLVLYRSPTTAMDQIANATPEQAKAGMDAWTAWAKEAGDSLVDLGAPLGDARRIGPGSPASGGDHITGYSIIEADTAEAAAGQLKDHPHLQMPGESSIEFLEFLPIPDM